MQQAALEYARRGFRVLLVNGVRPDGRCTCYRDNGGGKVCDAPGKHPLSKDWRTKATSDENEIKKWKAVDGLNIGVITGMDSEDIVIDVDPRHGGLDSLQSLVAQHGPLPSTLTVCTGGGGFHYHYRHPLGRPLPNKVGLLPGIDVRGDGGFIVMPPSRHASGGLYTLDGELGFATPMADLPRCFYHLITGMTPKASRGRGKRAKVTDEIPEGLRNSTLFGMARDLCRKGLNVDQIYEEISRIPVAEGDHPFTDAEKRQIAENANKYPPGNGKRDNGGGENRETVQAFSVITDDLIADTVYDPAADSPLRYAVIGADGEISYRDSIEVGGKEYAPRNDQTPRNDQKVIDLIELKVALFPKLAREYGTERELDEKIIRFLHSYVDVPEFWERLITAWIKMSWVYDRFNAIGYLLFLGPKGSGKTRIAFVASRICYRTVTASGASTVAAFQRAVALFKGTLYLDESEYRSDSEMATAVTRLLNAGYKRDLPALKCDEENFPVAFSAFGPKICTARVPFPDESTGDRCITLETAKHPVREDVGLHLPDAFDAEAAELLDMLLCWRLRNYRAIVLDHDTEWALRTALEPRLVEILNPLIAVHRDAAFLDELVRFALGTEAAQRQASAELFIAEAIRQLSGGRATSLTVRQTAEVASRLRREQEPKYVPKKGQAPPGYSKDGDDPTLYLSAKRCGLLLRSLGIVPEHKYTGAEFEVTEAKLAELKQRYPRPYET
jgi:putative DNA primase/helicase